MATITTASPPSNGSTVVPLLQQGDHLSRAEFERRYAAMPSLKKAELIEGIVYMPSPIRYDQHCTPQGDLIGWLWQYRVHTPGVRAGGNGSIRLDDKNEPQPDAILNIQPDSGGQARISEDDYLEGPPELVAEISASSVSFDLHTKKRVYERCGIKEYIVWRVVDQAIDWFILRNGRYELLTVKPEGYIESETFPGLRLAPAAMIGGDMSAVSRVLQEGINSPQHAVFVQRLRAK
jgi:Uma2 family endonuclease